MLHQSLYNFTGCTVVSLLLINSLYVWLSFFLVGGEKDNKLFGLWERGNNVFSSFSFCLVGSKLEERNYLTFKKTYICFWRVWMKNAQLTLLFSCLEWKKIMLLLGHDWVKHVIFKQAFILILRICAGMGLSITVWILSLLQHLSGLSSSAYCRVYFCIAT
jgi:hypothetical protein